ncbi:MAG: response regulator [Bacteroidota bacterium]|jgi:CheY-like chemotaxis protein
MKTIFLIDDDEVTNFINKRIIKLNLPDVEIHVAANATEAIQRIKQRNADNLPAFDAIMIDISMPDMDGWEFMDLMETDEFYFTNQTSFFMLTSSVFEDDLNRSKTKKLIRSFFSKPLDANKVQEIAAAIL